MLSADSAVEERGVVAGHQHGAPGLVEPHGAQVGAVQLDGGVGVTRERVEQRGGVGRPECDHPEVFSCRDLESADAQRSRRLRGQRPVGVAHGRRGGEQRGHPLGRPARPGQQRADLGEPLQRTDQEDRQPGARDQLPDADRALQREPPADPRHHDEQEPRDDARGAEVAGFEPGGREAGVQGGAARAAVGLGRGPFGADALEHPQPGDDVGGHAGGGGERGLLRLGPGDQRPRQQPGGHHDHRDAAEDDESEQHRGLQQHDGTTRQRGERPGRGGDRLAHEPGPVGVGAREAHQLTRAAGGPAPGVQHAPGDGEPDLVRRLPFGADGEPVAEVAARGEHHEHPGDDAEPPQQGDATSPEPMARSIAQPTVTGTAASLS